MHIRAYSFDFLLIFKRSMDCVFFGSLLPSTLLWYAFFIYLIVKFIPYFLRPIFCLLRAYFMYICSPITPVEGQEMNKFFVDANLFL